MLFFTISISIAAVGELLLFLFRHIKKQKRAHATGKSLYKLMEERVLSETLRNQISNEEAVRKEYQSIFLLVEFPDTRPWKGYVFPLDEAVTIGRSRENKINIRDDMVSRLHCKIAWINGQLYLQDMGTANGTQLKRGIFGTQNLSSGEIMPLEDGDQIVTGRYRMRIHLWMGYEARM